MSNQQITIKDVIALSIKDLQTLSIPADLLEMFGPPISRTLGRLKMGYQAIVKAENIEAQQILAKAQKAEEESEEAASGIRLVDKESLLNEEEEELDDAEEKDQLESPIQE